jgi:citrate lyase beta subunit
MLLPTDPPLSLGWARLSIPDEIVSRGAVGSASTSPWSTDAALIDFDLFLFARDPGVVSLAVDAGVDGVVIDWERRGKHRRQAGADTEINADTPDDLRRVRFSTGARVICRINAVGPETAAEVDEAIACGADEILVPMVREPAEVEAVLETAAGRCGVDILVETTSAVENADRLGELPLSRAYVGLNDLAIDRGAASIFEAVADRTVERVRASFAVPFGFAGLTHPDLGAPIPARLLIAEMARLRASFGFLRRSYRADVPVGEQGPAIAAIREALERAWRRSHEEVERDAQELRGAVQAQLAR